MTRPTVEHGLVVGNTYDKYGTRNPIARRLVAGFLAQFDELVDRTDARRVLEVGCGEGELAFRMAGAGMDVHATDISGQMIEEARARVASRGVSVTFEQNDLFGLNPADGTFDLVVCCEVLEHLEDPHRAVAHVAALSHGYAIFSVPREPIWRFLNVLRGSYLLAFGNTPGHVQHWSRRTFHRLLHDPVEIVEYRAPFPWLMALCRVAS